MPVGTNATVKALDPDDLEELGRRIEAARTRAAETEARRAELQTELAEVERLADRVILLQAGRIIEDETPQALIEAHGRQTLEDVFLDVVRGRNAQAVPESLAS